MILPVLFLQWGKIQPSSVFEHIIFNVFEN